MPVYGPDGSLQAVVGTDLFLDNMQEALQSLTVEGEYYLLVNGNGLAVPGPQTDAFPMNMEDQSGDLRNAQFSLLSQAVADALEGKATAVDLGDLADGRYHERLFRAGTETGLLLFHAFGSRGTGGGGQHKKGSRLVHGTLRRSGRRFYYTRGLQKTSIAKQ